MTESEVLIDGDKVKCTVKQEVLLFSPLVTDSSFGEYSGVVASCDSFSMEFEDIICLKHEGSLKMKPPTETTVTVINFIKKRDDVREWVNQTLKISHCPGKEDEFKKLVEDIQAKFDRVVETRPKQLLVLMNPIAGNRKARKMFDTIVLPLFQLAGIRVELIVSERQKHLIEVMSCYNYKSVDGIVMMGGDGTLHEVVNVLIRRTQEDAGINFNDSTAVLQPVPIPLAIIPTGSGNAVAMKLTGCQDVTTSTLHVIRGKYQDLDILSTHCDGKSVGYSTCAMGLGALADFIDMADRKLRWMKARRYNAVVNMYPFRRIHFLESEITIYNSKMGNLGTEDEIVKSDVTEKDIINQRTSMLMASTMDIWSTVRRPEGKMFLAIYEEMGGCQMYRIWKNMMLQRDRRLNGAHVANSFRIRFKPELNIPSVYNEMVSLDGELQVCSKPEYFVQVLQGVVQMFTSM